MLRTMRRAIGWIVLLLSAGHFYYVYPLPAERAAQMIQSAAANAQPAVEGPQLSKEMKAADGSATTEPDRQAIESLVWEGWWIGLLLVGLGSAAGVYSLLCKDRSWLLAALLFAVIYVVIYWVVVVLPVGGSVSEFFTLKWNTFGSLYRIGRTSGMLIELHQFLSTVVFHLVLVFCAVMTFGALRSQPD